MVEGVAARICDAGMTLEIAVTGVPSAQDPAQCHLGRDFCGGPRRQCSERAYALRSSSSSSRGVRERPVQGRAAQPPPQGNPLVQEV